MKPTEFSAHKYVLEKMGICDEMKAYIENSSKMEAKLSKDILLLKKVCKTYSGSKKDTCLKLSNDMKSVLDAFYKNHGEVADRFIKECK